MPAPRYTPPTERQAKQRAIFDAILFLRAIPATIEHPATKDGPASAALFHPAIFFTFPAGTPAEIIIGRYPWDGCSLLTVRGAYRLDEAEARAREAADTYNRVGFRWTGYRFSPFSPADLADPMEFAPVSPAGEYPEAAAYLNMPIPELQARSLLAGTGDLVLQALTHSAADVLSALELGDLQADATDRAHGNGPNLTADSATLIAVAYLLARIARLELSQAERAIVRRLSALLG
jgi:hypothetical protein